MLLLLGPAHLVPDSFWEAAKVLLETSGDAGPQSELCVHVPVVTTVPITQVKCAASALCSCNSLTRQRQEQLLEWGKTWPISHRQPGAVLPPPPLSPTEIRAMCRPYPRAQSPLHLLFTSSTIHHRRT